MLNLSEEWKKAYAEYLNEQEAKRPSFDDELNEAFDELNRAHNEAEKTFKLVEDYFELYADYEMVNLTEMPTPNSDPDTDNTGDATAPVGIVSIRNNASSQNNNRTRQQSSSQNNDRTPEIRELLKKVTELSGDIQGYINNDNNDSVQSYAAEVRTQEEHIRDMKFPRNVIFFISSLIKWIGKVVVFLIEKFKNLLRRLIGDKPKALSSDELKLQLSRVKKIENLTTPARGSGVVSQRVVNSKDINVLQEGLFDDIATQLGIIKKSDVGTPSIKNTPVIISVDLSKDLMNISELMQHFYDMFDNAYGSNNEQLFQTDDLKLILDIFNDTMTRIKNGSSTVYSYGGSAVEVDQINVDRVMENLKMTSTNINNLKNVYLQTSDKIKDILKIIQSKEMLMINQLGTSYQLLSSATYQQLIRITDSIPKRLREAEDLEKDLNTLKKNYDALAKQLAATQKSVLSIGNIQYDTIYNRKMIQLFRAASAMRDVVTLRLSGIGLYIKELKEVQDAMEVVVAFNRSSAVTAKK